MGITALSVPLVVASKGSGNQNVLPTTEQAAPSLIFGGVMLQDPRRLFVGGEVGPETSALMGIGAGLGGCFTVMDQIPATLTINNLAVAAAVTSGTAMTLVTTSGAGITLLASALTIPQTGNIVPTGKLVIEGTPGIVTYGSGKSLAVADPTKSVARAIAITASSAGTGGAFLVTGYDLYGYPQTEKITVAAGTSGGTTTNGKKTFKFITSVTPQITDTVSYSVGVADIIGFPMRVDRFPYAQVGFLGALIAVSTGFVAADAAVATNTTGDVRGTYALQTASNNARPLEMFVTVSPANISTIAGMFGVIPA